MGGPLEVKRILKDPASRHALNDHTLYTELGNAIRFKHQDLFKPMIDAEAPVNPINAKAGHNKSSPLMIAVEDGNQWIVRCLLENGADVNYNFDTRGSIFNALRCAIETKSASMVSLLLAYGADVDARRTLRCGCLAIHQALEMCSIPIVGLLLEHGADIDIVCAFPGTPVRVAINTENVQALRFLVGKGANVNKECFTRFTPYVSINSSLLHATTMNSLEMVRILVENGAVLGLQHAKKYARDTTGLSNRIEIMRLLDQQMSRPRNDRTIPAGD